MTSKELLEKLEEGGSRYLDASHMKFHKTRILDVYDPLPNGAIVFSISEVPYLHMYGGWGDRQYIVCIARPYGEGDTGVMVDKLTWMDSLKRARTWMRRWREGYAARWRREQEKRQASEA